MGTVRKLQRSIARAKLEKAGGSKKRIQRRARGPSTKLRARATGEKLYVKLRTKDDSNWYMPVFRGRHNIKVYSRAMEAQARSLAVRDRYRRLRAAHDEPS